MSVPPFGSEVLQAIATVEPLMLYESLGRGVKGDSPLVDTGNLG